MTKTSYVPSSAKIKVIGVGGGGCNAVTRMVREQIHGVEFIAMNTDAKHLLVTEATIRLQLGERSTRGLGAGGDYKAGQKAAEESYDEIKKLVQGADMIFIAAGMGGGTGTGSAPVVAELARKTGALTIGVVTRPFSFEGSHRSKMAEEGILNLVDKVDTLVIIPNDRLLTLCDQKTGVDGAFKLADQILHHGVQAIAEVVTVPGLVNLDFADVRSVMKNAGPAWMSVGKATGQNRAKDAAKEALSSPILDVSVSGAKGVLFNIAGRDLTLFEVNDAADVIRQAVDPRANIIFGVVLDPNMGKEVRLTLIATGFASKGINGEAKREQEILTLLKGKSMEELQTPAFLRYRQSPSGQLFRPNSTPRR
jgi:cell division protein FtsZ